MASARSARTWVRKGTVRYVVLTVSSPQAFSQLGIKGSKKTRLIGIVRLPAATTVGLNWNTAVATAAGGGPDLGVSAAGGTSGPALGSYLGVLKSATTASSQAAAAPTSSDVTAPTAPTNLVLLATGDDFLTVGWTASTDDVGVTGYEYFLNGKSAGTTQQTTAIISQLQCGIQYDIGVEAYDAAGNHSPQATLGAEWGCIGGGSAGGAGGGGGAATPATTTASSSGGGGGGGGGGDTTPPSSPTGLAESAATPTAVTLSWTASTDNVGVTGYDLYLNGVGVGTSTQTTYAFSGLSCGTSYTLGVDAYDAAGNKSPAASFIASTAACADTTPPSAPSNLSQTAATTTSVSAGWTASTDNVGVTGYEVFIDNTLAGTTTATSYTLSGLACGTSHQIVVDAYDAAGNHSSQASVSMATSACAAPPPGDTQPPTTPSGLSASSPTRTTVALSWTASTDDVGVVGYGVYSNGSLVATPSTTGYTLSGLTCGTSYTVAVDAYDAAGNRSAKTTITTATSSCPDTSPPTTPSGLSVGTRTTTSLALSWTGSTDNVGVAGYGVYNNGSLVASPTGTSYTLSGLTCGTSYTVAVDAYDAAGNRSAKTTIITATSSCPDTTPPSAPTGLSASFVTQAAATLSWTASTDNVGVTGYDLYLEGVGVGTTAATSYAFSGLSCGTAYTLGVDAHDAAGNKSAISTLIVTTNACADTSPPSAPTNLQETASTTTTITAAWTASTDNVGVTGYRVFVDGSLAGTTSATSYVASGLSCGTSHQIVVDAHDAAGNNSAQTAATMATAACAPPPPGDTQAPTTPGSLGVSSATQTTLALTWSASTDNVGVVGYGVYSNGTLVASPTATGYTLTGLTCGTSYTVAVDAYDAAGNRSAKTSITTSTAACPDTQPPTVPSGVALATSTATSISITWTASTDNVGVAGYDLYLAGSAVGTATATSYTYSGLTCGSNYTLGVDAYDGAGNHSTQATVILSTTACADTTPPSVPQSQTVSSTQTTIVMSWQPSTDNVGVAGYGVYLNGTLVGTTTSTAYTYTGLTCGTTYTVGLDAFDAAGNRSNVAAATGSIATAACSGGGGPGTANVYVSPSGNDSTCVRGDASHPCATWQAACAQAQSGDVIGLGTGNYGTITLTSCSNVTIEPLSGATVTGKRLYASGSATLSHVTIEGPITFTEDGSQAAVDIEHSTYLTLDGLTATEANNAFDVTFFSNGDHLTVANSDFCCTTDHKVVNTDAGLTNVTFDHDYLHGIVVTNSGDHDECLYDNGIVGFTISRTAFWNCGTTGDMDITQSGSAAFPDNTTLVNNIWGPSDNTYAIQGYTHDETVQNNLFLYGIAFNNTPTGTNTFVGNIGNIGGSCQTDITFAYNNWQNMTCSATDTKDANNLSSGYYVAPGSYAYGAARGDWHYSSSNSAISHGDPGNCPSTDLDGNSRVVSSCSAGPYRYGNG